MKTLTCPLCKNKFDSKSSTCPNCGYPYKFMVEQQEKYDKAYSEIFFGRHISKDCLLSTYSTLEIGIYY